MMETRSNKPFEEIHDLSTQQQGTGLILVNLESLLFVDLCHKFYFISAVVRFQDQYESLFLTMQFLYGDTCREPPITMITTYLPSKTPYVDDRQDVDVNLR